MIIKVKNLIYKLLRRSEKYTQTDMVYLAKGGFWLTGGQIITSVSTLLLAIAFANLLPREVYGSYKYILSIFAILTITTLSGIDSSITRAVAQGNEGSFVPALKTKIKWGILGALAGLILASYYWFNGNNTLAIGFVLVALVTPLVESLALYQAYYNGRKDFARLTKFTITTSLVSTLAIITTIYFTNNLFLVLLAFFIPLIILRTIYLILILVKNKPNKSVDKGAVKYGKHLSFLNVLGTIAMQIDKVLVFHYLGAVELAIYSFALAPLEQMKSLIKPIATLATPKFATKKLAEIKNSLITKVFKLSGLLIIVSIIYIFLAPLLYKLLFPQYLDSVIYSQIFAISFATLSLILVTSVFEAQKMIREIYLYKIISGISQIIISFILIVNFGLLGAVWSRVIIRFINFLSSIFLLKQGKNID